MVDSGEAPGDALLAPGCAGLMATCGASGSDSCCTSFVVSGGTYYRSYDVGTDGIFRAMLWPAMVNDFRLDTYEVTVGRFRAFVNAGMGTQSSPPPRGAGTHGNIAGSGWDTTWNANLVNNKDTFVAQIKCDPVYQTWTDAPGPNENRPMNCITWYEAMAFCAWDNAYLPTEAEWNYAASAGDQQRAYPWSVPASSIAIDSSRASFFDGDCNGDGMPGCALTDLTAVGAKPNGDGYWRQSDLSGNVTEWVLDWYAPYPTPCTDCVDLVPATSKVIRGGHFHSPANDVRTGHRDYRTPLTRAAEVGVRCARPPR